MSASSSATPLLRPMGDRAVLLELASLDEVVRVHRALVETRPAGLVDLVPAARTILAVTEPRGPALAALGSWLLATAARVLRAPSDADSRDPDPHDAEPRVAVTSTEPDVTVHVRYDGQDLDETAALLGLDRAELVALHTGSVWTVAFSGFSPGFGYLVTDHDRLVVPRLAVPRTSVPGGSVALAGAFSGVYPRASPGGWRIIGTTDAVLWNPDAEQPALLVPGRTVRFSAVTA